ncbi:MAG: phenylalanine--tRNA ligase beta subunit-related protein [Fervidicoccaceae archaeon]
MSGGFACFGRRLSVARELSERGVFVAASCLGIEGRDESLDYASRLRELEDRVRRTLASRVRSPEFLKDDPIVRAYRSFFWSLGIDPTKIRPAGEALARRLLRGESLPTINRLVDAGNLASSETLVPIGIYDVDKLLPGELSLEYSKGGEVFAPIGGERRVLERGVPVLKSGGVLVVHVYPYRDSRETCVDDDTKRAVVIGAGVAGVPASLVSKAVELVHQYALELGLKLSIAREVSLIGGAS